MLANILTIIQLILAVLLVLVILLQQQGSGLGAAFGGTGGIQTTRRGADKLLFRATIVISVLFFVVALANVIL